MEEYERMYLTERVFKEVFGKSVHVESKRVKPGGTSNNIYVPRKFADCPVTLIIWPKEESKNVDAATGGENER